MLHIHMHQTTSKSYESGRHRHIFRIVKKKIGPPSLTNPVSGNSHYEHLEKGIDLATTTIS